MVSPLWKASSEGDLDKVNALLADPATVDLEVKDHTGSTPLIEAVKNGHVEIVKALLAKGADPGNASSQGRPEQYTSDPAILELLTSAQNVVAQNNELAYAQNGPNDTEKQFYPSQPPPAPYTYYPTINPSLSAMGEGPVYYPQQPPLDENNANAGLGHLPPPEIARLIPCRYYPACRYGAQCMFAHPQAPFYQGAPPTTGPPGPYPPYDPALGSPYGYYPPPPPPFQQPNGAPVTPLSPPPQPHVMHSRNPSEIVSPSQSHFPNGAPAPMPYGPMPPNGYPHPGQVPIPMAGPPLPPLHHQPPPPPPSGPAPQSPSAMYNNLPVHPPFPGPDVTGQYMPPPPPGPIPYPEIDGSGKQPLPNGHPENYGPHPVHRDGNGHRRGVGVGRRGSFANKKPPCLFFPAGRCKNGDDCRFPHVLADGSGPNNYYSTRGGAPRPRAYPHNNGVAAIEQKMGNMTVRDDTAARPQNGAPEGLSRSHSTDSGNRPRYQQGTRQPGNGVNGKKHTPAAPKPQRLPSADDFPVLPGSITPPTRQVNGVANGNALNGPTAAQVLQAPPPLRKENSRDSTRGLSPESTQDAPEEQQQQQSQQDEAAKPPAPASAAAPEQQSQPQQAPQQQQAPPVGPAQKLPVSFAAAAAASASAPDVSNEVSVSA